MFFRTVYKSGQIFLPFCHNTRAWQTDRQTDRQTEISSLYRVSITCSAVKMHFAWRKSATKFLCVKTVSGKVVRHSLA